MIKKLFIAVAVLLSIGVVCIYVLIPKQLTVSEHIKANTNDKWAFKYLMHEIDWKQWWPADSIHQKGSDTVYKYDDLWFHIDSLYYNALTIKIASGDDTMKSRLIVIPLQENSVSLVWQCFLNGSGNPFARFRRYREAVAIKKSMTGIMSAYQRWLNVPENIYGFKIIEGHIIDTLLIASRATFNNYPDAGQVDSVLEKVRNYIRLNHGDIVGYPMVNVTNDSLDIFNTQVALPINHEIPQTKDIRIKRMFAGNALVIKIKGGPYTINKAYEACENYKHDHARVSPAIPFQSMITNRITEPDTSKWETIIYYPVK